MDWDRDKEVGEIAWVKNRGGRGEKDGERWLFAKIVVISRFTKTPDSYPANSLKKTPRCLYFLGEKSMKNQQWST